MAKKKKKKKKKGKVNPEEKQQEVQPSRPQSKISNDLNDWMALPVMNRPTFAVFQRQRRAQVFQGSPRLKDSSISRRSSQYGTLKYRSPLSSGAVRKSSTFGTELTRGQRKSNTPLQGKSRPNTPLQGKLRPNTPLQDFPIKESDRKEVQRLVRQDEIFRLRRELADAKAKNAQAIQRSESSFRKWAFGIIGNVVTTLTLGGLRSLWTMATSLPPFF